MTSSEGKNKQSCIHWCIQMRQRKVREKEYESNSSSPLGSSVKIPNKEKTCSGGIKYVITNDRPGHFTLNFRSHIYTETLTEKAL